MPQHDARRALGLDFGTTNTVKSEAGPWAVQKFIEIAGDCRFIQSLKSFAASRLFEST